MATLQKGCLNRLAGLLSVRSNRPPAAAPNYCGGFIQRHILLSELLAEPSPRDQIPLPDVQVLSTADENKELIRIDPLQRLHTLTNLSELLAGGVPGVPRTLRDDLLQSHAEEIRQVSCLIWLTGRSTAKSTSVAITMTHRKQWQLSIVL